jgi:hypothetical protein
MFMRIYTGSDGESHFEDLTEALTSDAAELRKLRKAEGIFFTRNEPGFDSGWHTAPRRQYVISILGEMEIALTDGTALVFGPGDVLLAEDTTGNGHRTRVIGDSVRVSAMVPLRDQD